MGLGRSLGASGSRSFAAAAASCAASWGWLEVASFRAETALLAASLGCSGMLEASGVASLLPPAVSRFLELSNVC